MVELPQSDLALQMGLLMEAAQTQQRLSQESLEGLQSHLHDLEGVVRDETHRSLTETLADLVGEITQAAQALRRLRRAAELRVFAWTLAVTVVSAAVAMAIQWLVLPSLEQIEALQARRESLAVDVTRLEKYAGEMELRRCGERGRLCVRVYRNGPAYGVHRDFLLVKER